MEALKKLNITDLDRVHTKWSQTVLEFSDDISVFQEIEEVIKLLSESTLQTGIVTSKTHQEMIDEFDPFGLSNYFDYTISASDTKKHKPHPEPLLACLEGLNAHSNEAVYIGDSIYDMQSAKAAGIPFALALWGSRTTDGFEEAEYVLRKPKHILELTINS